MGHEAVKIPSLDYSHFISLPLAIHPELVDKPVNFQNSIPGITDSSRGENLVEKSIFIKPETFHLTVLMLKSWNKLGQSSCSYQVIREAHELIFHKETRVDLGLGPAEDPEGVVGSEVDQGKRDGAQPGLPYRAGGEELVPEEVVVA
ncbi:hypothetical protein ACLB2K_034485 [Fragaria x ananassa]